MKEKTLLLKLQSDFPLKSRPYQEIAKKFGRTEKEIINILKNLKKKGIIRYIGGAFNLKKLGAKSSLIALSVPPQNLSKAVRIINAYPNVSHNYLRTDKFNPPSRNSASARFLLHQTKRKNSASAMAHRFNLWFTVSASSMAEIIKIVKDIKKKTRAKDVLNLFTLKVFKIDARFKI